MADDADVGMAGPTGVTVPVGVVEVAQANAVIQSFEMWTVTQPTTTQWHTDGGPAFASGIFVPIFRQHSLTNGLDPLATQAGVTVTKSGAAVPADDFYFVANETNLHMTIDPTATSTAANGTALFTSAAISDGIAYSGTGGIADTTNCKWESHAGASLPNTLLVQVFRPTSQVSHTCPL